MGDRRQEGGLHAVQFAQPLVGRRQFPGLGRQVPGTLHNPGLQLPGIVAHEPFPLPVKVDAGHQLLGAQAHLGQQAAIGPGQLVAFLRSKYPACGKGLSGRRRPHGPGQLGLHGLVQIGQLQHGHALSPGQSQGLRPAVHHGQCLGHGKIHAHKTGQEIALAPEVDVSFQMADQGRAPVLAWGAKQVGCAPVLAVLTEKEAPGHEEPDIDGQGPEHGMGHPVHARQPEKGLGTQGRHPEKAVIQDVSGQPAGAGQGGHDHGVKPGQKTAAKPQKRPGPPGVAPEKPHKQGRRELEHGGKGDDAQVRQHEGLAHPAFVPAGQGDDACGGGAPGPQEPAAQEAQEGDHVRQGKQQMVDGHGGQGHRADHDHPGRGGEAAQKHQEGQPRPVVEHGQAQHVGVGRLHRQPGQQSLDGDGQDKERDAKQIQGKGPGRRAHMVHVGIFHHGGMELTGQEHGGRGRQDQKARPAHVSPGPFGERRGQDPGGTGPGKEIGKAAVYAEDHKKTHSRQGRQLHRRLGGHHGHQAGVPFRGVQAAQSEQDGKKDHAHHHARPHNAALRDGPSRPGHDGEGGDHGSQLQGQVRGHAAKRQQGDQGGHGRGFAVPGAEEVGDAGAVQLIFQADHARQKHGPEKGGQGRPQVGGVKHDAG
ncbi:hypothetical protein ASZ90_000428 [hydrocarbon metagenome]|uniref:Uncharacterized protein n=1 Tax=hydrocarbon metagenome TaxID=938273 RepID=A0A0W8G9D0_9ZZZZ